MRKFIDADRLRANIEALIAGTPSEWTGAPAAIEAYKDVLNSIELLQEEQPAMEELPPVVPLSKFPTLRQSIEEQLYAQVMRKLPGCPPHAGITVTFTLRPSTVNNLKKDYEQNGVPATAVGKVFTNTDPKLLTVDSDEWQSVLGQFDNGQRVRVILVKEDAE